MKLQNELPVDHHLATVYRYGAAFCGLVLLVFAGLGFADALSSFETSGDTIAGMTTNVALSVISTVVGFALLVGAAVGGNFASTLNMVVGGLFVLSGLAHIFILDTSANVLDFGMTNVIFSFVMGLLIATFGMYGRVSSKLSPDNPYWRRRHAEAAVRARAAVIQAAAEPAALPRKQARPLPSDGSEGPDDVRRAIG
ncbi:DUF4383 domain-containing protein [Streptomyces sp. WMMC897]|uniref:DUF4383 domain-containing protein n=1 Tax=Streptomyces sp. WMMC897 TaxID=3014782 RepID=UPI0022B7129A|nr:DUF4383 domain-containing protein [Streptomyces sp. WMMC897]MCZ7415862.1 DUF4383 domain-containing protein [Streptomyces sp. WMMC897]